MLKRCHCSQLGHPIFESLKCRQKTPLRFHAYSHRREGHVRLGPFCPFMEFLRIRISEDGAPASVFFKISDYSNLNLKNE